MMRKYMDDAQKVMAADRDRLRVTRQAREATLHRYLIIKRILLGIALAGIAGGLYYAHDLGGMLGTNISTTHYSAPIVDPAPVSKAKYLRKLSEKRKQRDDELEEIEKF